MLVIATFSFLSILSVHPEPDHKTQLSNNAIRVLQSRYLKRGEHGKPDKTPQQMFQRLAKTVAQAELNWYTTDQALKWKRSFYDMMKQLLFLPNSPALMNAGTRLNQLSACLVLPVEDHLEDIFSTLKLAALIQQSEGGTGFNFSPLHPKNDVLNRTQGIASGPVSFMKIFDAATEHVKQGWKNDIYQEI